MPQLSSYKVRVTVEVDVTGNSFADAAKRAEDLIAPSLKRDAPSADYPIIRSARIARIDAEGS